MISIPKSIVSMVQLILLTIVLVVLLIPLVLHIKNITEDHNYHSSKFSMLRLGNNRNSSFNSTIKTTVYNHSFSKFDIIPSKSSHPLTNSNSKIYNQPNKKTRTESASSSMVTTNTSISVILPPSAAKNSVTDLSRPVAMIKCDNQTKCIQPVLQLKRDYKIYYCKHLSHGVRFYFLAREGLLLHPRLIFVSKPEDADVIVYLPESAVWHKTECAKPEYRSKLLVLDEGDGSSLFQPGEKFLLQFKRSYVRRRDGQFQGYMGYLSRPDVLPMVYTIADAYVKNTFNTQANRDIDILCTLRGGAHDPNRRRVREWVEEYAKTRGVKKFIAKQINGASRTVISGDYFGQMHRSRIIVTANPSGWEGDFRLCEAMASGALIFVDQMYVPRPSPLVDGKHIVVFDNHNKTDLFSKLDTYRRDTELARRTALTGYLHAMRYHRAANLMDYIFRTIHTKELAEHDGKYSMLTTPPWKMDNSGSDPRTGTSGVGYGYTDTGYEMRWHAMAVQEKYDRQKKAEKLAKKTAVEKAGLKQLAKIKKNAHPAAELITAQPA